MKVKFLIFSICFLFVSALFAENTGVSTYLMQAGGKYILIVNNYTGKPFEAQNIEVHLGGQMTNIKLINYIISNDRKSFELNIGIPADKGNYYLMTRLDYKQNGREDSVFSTLPVSIGTPGFYTPSARLKVETIYGKGLFTFDRTDPDETITPFFHGQFRILKSSSNANQVNFRVLYTGKKFHTDADCYFIIGKNIPGLSPVHREFIYYHKADVYRYNYPITFIVSHNFIIWIGIVLILALVIWKLNYSKPLLDKAEQLRQLALSALRRFAASENFPVIMLLVLSSVIKFIYVFNFTDYTHYVTSDMQGYWDRGIERFTGDDMNPDQWSANASFFPWVLSLLFQFINVFGLYNYKLVTILLCNIALSTLGVWFLYKIGMLLMKKRKWALGLAAAYAFSYPLIYFNSFVMAEPFAIPLIIGSIYLLFKYKDGYFIFLSGLLLGLGVALRPSNALLGLPFALYVFLSVRPFSIKSLWKSGLRAAVFSLAFFAVMFYLVSENMRISNGELKTLTAHSGYNFFLGCTDAFCITSKYSGITYGFVPSSVANHPELGTIVTSVPIYDYKTFYKMGWDFIKENPQVWVRNLLKYRFLFFDNLFPAAPSSRGFIPLFDIFRYALFYMFLLLGLLYLSFKDKRLEKDKVLLFIGIFVISAAGLFFYTVTHQYFYNFAYTVYILFFVMLFSVSEKWKKNKKLIAYYLAAVLILTAGSYGIRLLLKMTTDRKIQCTVSADSSSITNISQQRNTVKTETFYADELNFYWDNYLHHYRLGKCTDVIGSYFLDYQGGFDVLREGKYTFFVYSDAGYRLKIDDKTVLEFQTNKTMLEGMIEQEVYLSNGNHTFSGTMFKYNYEQGLIAFYLGPDAVKPHRIIQDDDYVFPKDAVKYYIGQDSRYIRFNKFK
jgi:hypothetical protein